MKSFSIGLALVFIVALGVLVILNRLPIWVPVIFIGVSVATFVVYWWDKNAARKGKWRIPENTLHILALVGGWPGALIGQQTLRHKTQKRSFRVVFWLSVMVNLAVFTWLLAQGYLSALSGVLE